MTGPPSADRLLSTLDRLAFVRDGWRLDDDGFWTIARPPDVVLPGQGWKLHVSTIPTCAARTLAQCAGVLREERVPFKFARDVGSVATLVSPRYDETGLGKFLTAYPAGPDEVVRAADRLAKAVHGMPGPAVPTDARWSPDAPVFYRYGVFVGQDWLTDDGGVCSALFGPSGEFEIDDRSRFAPPPWAPALPRPPTATPGGRTGAGRFRVTEVLLRSARGGVFVALDGDRTVVIKHARAYVGSDHRGSDARDRLRHEAAVLEDLAGTGAAPRFAELITAAQASMLVMERVAGQSLRAWVLGRWRPPAGLDPHARAAAIRLAAAVQAVHERGYVLRDLTPSNVVISPDSAVRLVDLELAARPGEPVAREYTAGYAAPEQMSAAPTGPAPDFAADSYALGGVLFFLATGADPDVPPGDRGPDLLLPARLAAAGAPAGLGRLVADLMADDPGRRPSAGRAAEMLRYLDCGAGSWPVPSAAAVAPALDDVLIDGLSALWRSLAAQPDAVAWRRSRDPLCLGYGRSGPLLLAARAFVLVDGLGLRPDVAALASDIQARLTRAPRVLPGLASGRPGILWALWEAAQRLGDAALADACLCLARDLPPVERSAPPSPIGRGLAHGTAGQGMFLLRLWHATGQSEWRERVLAHVDDALRPDRRSKGRSDGQAPEVQAPSGVLTLANGAVGRALFLLHAGVALAHEKAVDRASLIVDHVIARCGDDRPAGDLSHDSGLAGAGRLLAAAAELVGHGPARTTALSIVDRLAGWVVHTRPGLAQGVCGWVELALDLGVAGQDRAADLLGELLARASRSRGRWLVPDDSGMGYHYALADGVSGWLWALHRATRGGPGLWDPRPVIMGAPS